MADLTVAIVRPQQDRFSGRLLHVVARVESTFEITSVRARVEGRETSMAFSTTAYSVANFGNQPGWVGDLPLGDLPRGSHEVVVTAVDAVGTMKSATSRFVLDEMPVLTLGILDYSVARPTIPFDATCSDDDGCTIQVIVNETPIPTGPVLDLTAFDHKQVTLRVKAIDTVAQNVIQERIIFVKAILVCSKKRSRTKGS
jgi:hypothetical protein